MGEDSKNEVENQGANWDEELKSLIKEAKKAKKKFPGFSVKGQVQVYEQIVHEMWNLSDPALRCLLFIARQTLGWGKDFDWITISQFQKGIQGKDKDKPYFRGVGKGKDAIIRGLRELEENGCIHKRVVCPDCMRDVPQIEKKIERGGKEFIIKQVQGRCPHCHAELLGREKIYYGLHFRPDAYDPERARRADTGGVAKPDTGGVAKPDTQVSKGTSIKNHHRTHEEGTTVQEGASQDSKCDDDEVKKPSEEKTFRSQAYGCGHNNSHDQSGSDAYALTDEAERVVEAFRQAFGPPKGLKECTAELNEMVEVFGEKAFFNAIGKVVELGVKPSSVKYIMTCVIKGWDGTCPACEGWGMNNRTSDGRCPLCRGQRHFDGYLELKRARAKNG